MRGRLARGAKNIARQLGVEIGRYRPNGPDVFPPDFDGAAVATILKARPYTMTSPERLFALVQSVRYLASSGITGDIVECGVWRGGSMMAAALTLVECGDVSRDLFLFDTFDGMAAPTERDVAIDGRSAGKLLQAHQKTEYDSVWCYATLNTVKDAMAATGYRAEAIHYIEGKVEVTIPRHAPTKIALLRLDTDWYESTRHEMEHLFPRLVKGGVLIIDDYGHWKGARQAVDEYLSSNGVNLLLNRIDYTGRIAVKTE
jgi:O-methyltransferase